MARDARPPAVPPAGPTRAQLASATPAQLLQWLLDATTRLIAADQPATADLHAWSALSRSAVAKLAPPAPLITDINCACQLDRATITTWRRNLEQVLTAAADHRERATALADAIVWAAIVTGRAVHLGGEGSIARLAVTTSAMAILPVARRMDEVAAIRAQLVADLAANVDSGSPALVAAATDALIRTAKSDADPAYDLAWRVVLGHLDHAAGGKHVRSLLLGVLGKLLDRAMTSTTATPWWAPVVDRIRTASPHARSKYLILADIIARVRNLADLPTILAATNTDVFACRDLMTAHPDTAPAIGALLVTYHSRHYPTTSADLAAWVQTWLFLTATDLALPRLHVQHVVLPLVKKHGRAVASSCVTVAATLSQNDPALVVRAARAVGATPPPDVLAAAVRHADPATRAAAMTWTTAPVESLLGGNLEFAQAVVLACGKSNGPRYAAKDVLVRLAHPAASYAHQYLALALVAAPRATYGLGKCEVAVKMLVLRLLYSPYATLRDMAARIVRERWAELVSLEEETGGDAVGLRAIESEAMWMLVYELPTHRMGAATVLAVARDVRSRAGEPGAPWWHGAVVTVIRSMASDALVVADAEQYYRIHGLLELAQRLGDADLVDTDMLLAWNDALATALQGALDIPLESSDTADAEDDADDTSLLAGACWRALVALWPLVTARVRTADPATIDRAYTALTDVVTRTLHWGVVQTLAPILVTFHQFSPAVLRAEWLNRAVTAATATTGPRLDGRHAGLALQFRAALTVDPVTPVSRIVGSVLPANPGLVSQLLADSHAGPVLVAAHGTAILRAALAGLHRDAAHRSACARLVAGVCQRVVMAGDRTAADVARAYPEMVDELVRNLPDAEGESAARTAAVAVPILQFFAQCAVHVVPAPVPGEWRRVAEAAGWRVRGYLAHPAYKVRSLAARAVVALVHAENVEEVVAWARGEGRQNDVNGALLLARELVEYGVVSQEEVAKWWIGRKWRCPVNEALAGAVVTGRHPWASAGFLSDRRGEEGDGPDEDDGEGEVELGSTDDVVRLARSTSIARRLCAATYLASHCTVWPSNPSLASALWPLLLDDNAAVRSAATRAVSPPGTPLAPYLAITAYCSTPTVSASILWSLLLAPMYPDDPPLVDLAQRVIAPTRADRDFADEVAARAALAKALASRGDVNSVPCERVEALCARFEKEVADLDRIGVLVAASNAPGVVGRAVQYLGASTMDELDAFLARAKTRTFDDRAAAISRTILGARTSLISPLGRTRRVIDCTATSVSGRRLDVIETIVRKQIVPLDSRPPTDSAVRQARDLRARVESLVRSFCHTSPADRIKLLPNTRGAAASLYMIQTLRLDDRAAWTPGPRPVVFVSDMHTVDVVRWHAAAARVVAIPPRPDGQSLDTDYLEGEVRSAAVAQAPLLVGWFSVSAPALNGIAVDPAPAVRVMHQYGGFACVDYTSYTAFAAVDMSAPDAPDAAICTPSRLVGGAGAADVLITCSTLAAGTLSGGEPPDVHGASLVEVARCGMAVRVTQWLGPQDMSRRTHAIAEHVGGVLRAHPQIKLMGDAPSAPRLPVFALEMLAPQPSDEIGFVPRVLHPDFVATVLSDMFGIQTRVDLGSSALYLLLDPFTTDRDISMVLRAVSWVAWHGWRLLPYYRVHPTTELWAVRFTPATMHALSSRTQPSPRLRLAPSSRGPTKPAPTAAAAHAPLDTDADMDDARALRHATRLAHRVDLVVARCGFTMLAELHAGTARWYMHAADAAALVRAGCAVIPLLDRDETARSPATWARRNWRRARQAMRRALTVRSEMGMLDLEELEGSTWSPVSPDWAPMDEEGHVVDSVRVLDPIRVSSEWSAALVNSMDVSVVAAAADDEDRTWAVEETVERKATWLLGSWESSTDLHSQSAASGIVVGAKRKRGNEE
ncbi:hypothetical protein GGF32_008923 [Allomyces javanicus]|nr:hypothetical protein GGF32_008923 [Allomyces javanicus]